MDARLAVLHTGGRRYIRFATAGNGDPVAVELPSGRVVEPVTRRHPPLKTIVKVALYSTSLAGLCEVWDAFHAREPFYSRADVESLEASGQIDRLRTDLFADLERIDPGAATEIGPTSPGTSTWAITHRKRRDRRPGSIRSYREWMMRPARQAGGSACGAASGTVG